MQPPGNIRRQQRFMVGDTVTKLMQPPDWTIDVAPIGTNRECPVQARHPQSLLVSSRTEVSPESERELSDHFSGRRVSTSGCSNSLLDQLTRPTVDIDAVLPSPTLQGREDRICDMRPVRRPGQTGRKSLIVGIAQTDFYMGEVTVQRAG